MTDDTKTPVLIEWDDAHQTAYQAAAAFRPPYFNGPGFTAHSWVVEAIRTAHMDGQRHAQGLPKIDRRGALSKDEQEQRRLSRDTVTGEDLLAAAAGTELFSALAGDAKLRTKIADALRKVR